MSDVKDESNQKTRGRRKGRQPSTKYFERVRMEFVEEVSVLQRVAQLRKEGRWEKRLQKLVEPVRERCLWDIVIEEAVWVSSELKYQRKWRRAVAKKSVKIIQKHLQEKELKQKSGKTDTQKIKAAAAIAKLVKTFWSNVQTLVEFRENTISRKKDLDQRLSHLVNETEKYSEIVAQSFTENPDPGVDDDENESKRASYSSSPSHSSVVSTSTHSSKPTSSPSSLSKVVRSVPSVHFNDDAEFVPPSDSESDVDDTIAEEEAKEKSEAPDHKTELDDLEAENNMSIEELLAKYAKLVNYPDAYKEPEPEMEIIEPEPQMKLQKIQEPPATRRGRPLKQPQRLGCLQKETDSEEEDQEDENSSSSYYSADDTGSDFSQDEDDDDGTSISEANKSTDDLESLINSMSSQENEKKTTTTAEEQTNKLADLAESFKPKGNTLSSTTVVTKVPCLLRHSLREYQHIGLDWLVTMYKKRLNGILADEMGLGKTIQTIALLAYLAVEEGNWGPHLIIVPTSVMLNWEMELMKWCPGFKVLTYFGSQKERKLKRTGWTKPNSFHVCIVSYKLVIQDHQSFRRKRWKYLILDEAQNIKNFKSQRWQLLLNFHSQRRLLLTGTPLQNNLMELWSLLHFLMPNVFQSHMEFKDWFSNPMSGMVEGSQEYNEDIVRRLHKVIRPFILRRMKSEVEKQLPQKYEHVVMCALSKRQRFLYDEFMLRTQTQETLNQGNLLNVIGILMQLRKVCNHPNLFETRPIISPFHTDGINYQLPALVWDVLRDIQENPFRQYSPLFKVSNTSNIYSERDELRPIFSYTPNRRDRHWTLFSIKRGGIGKPIVTSSVQIINLFRDERPPYPRPVKPLQFVNSSNPDDGDFYEDTEVMECIDPDAVPSPVKSPPPDNSQESDAGCVGSQETVSTELGTCSVKDSDFTEFDPSSAAQSEHSDDGLTFDEVFPTKRKILMCKRLELSERLELMECTVEDMELDFIQERILRDRTLVVNKLNMRNMYRCNVQTSVNSQLLEVCQIVGSRPKLRRFCRRNRCRVAIVNKERHRNYEENGYFRLGWNECMKIIRVREEDPNLINNPVMLWSTTKYLDSAIKTPQTRVDELMSVLTRFVMYIPPVSAPALESLVYRPSTSARYFSDLEQVDEYRRQFVKRANIMHPIFSRMLTQFPDPRLIQYDCGKLQTLDLLLRRLKAESHRVLIFTQMAKVLDILEQFLTYHGHTYLRLDGATKIDQRQLMMERFNADKKIFCFILSTRSGGVGVNLTGADTVIFYDSDWNPTMDAQAQDRCHRIGQTRDVHIYRLVSEKTVEENILKKSNQKRLLGELAIEGGKFTTTFFKEQTIRELFTINEKEDVAKRLTAWNTSGPSFNETEDGLAVNSTDVLMKSPQRNRGIKMLECALAAAEDDRDVEATQTVHAETEAEFDEFDEDGLFDVTDKKGPTKFEIQFQQIYELMTDIERYALRSVQSWQDEWCKEAQPQVKIE